MSAPRAAALALAGLALAGPALADPPAAAPKLPATAPLVLHVGDSFVDAGLRQHLGPRLAAAGSRYHAESKTGSYLATWAFGRELDDLVRARKPALVLITLGASEVNADPPESRRKAVRAIVEKAGGRPCAWVGVPLWKGAKTGLMELVKKEAAPCRFFDSQAVAPKVTRQKDGVHPDKAGGAIWADAFGTWLLAQRDPKRPPWGLL